MLNKQYEGLREAQVFLAAESLKRRILSNIEENYKNIKVQQDLIISLINLYTSDGRFMDNDKSISKQDTLRRVSNNLVKHWKKPNYNLMFFKVLFIMKEFSKI